MKLRMRSFAKPVLRQSDLRLQRFARSGTGAGNGDASSSEKVRWELRKLKLDVLLAILGLLFAATISVGALLLYCYFFRLSFNPGGISASDTVSFSLLLFGFALTTFFGVFYFTIAGYPIARAGHKMLVKSQEWINAWKLWRRGAMPAGEVRLLIGNPVRQEWRSGMTIFIWLGLLLWLPLVLGFIRGNINLRLFLGPMLLVGIWQSIFVFGDQRHAYSKLPRKTRTLGRFDAWLDRQPWPIRQTIMSSIVTLGMLTLQMSVLQDASMLTLGFRKHDVSVRLSKDDYSAVVDRATRAGLVVNPCTVLDVNMPVIEHMDVLWHSLGTMALIRYPSLPLWAPERAQQSTLLFEPLSASITVMRAMVGQQSCNEFMADSLFREGRSDLEDQATAKLETDLPWLLDAPGRRRIYLAVIEPASPGLAADQAQVLKTLLSTKYRQPENLVVLEQGRKDLKRDCTGLRDGVACERANRRIEIRSELLPTSR